MKDVEVNPMAVTAAAELDAVALDKLRELDPDGRRGVLPRVLTAFESSLVRWLAQLEGQRSNGHPGVVNSIAHTLKSSAGSVGAKDLARACADVERRLRATQAGNAGSAGSADEFAKLSGELGAKASAELAADIELLLGLGYRALAAIRAMLRA